jgi:hypothetical protein
MLVVKGINVDKILDSFSDLVRVLRTLNIEKDEIVSDITYTILVCKKDFDRSKGNFFKYLYRSIENNMRRKIYAINAKNATQCELTFDLPTKKDSPLSEAVSECPELIDYVLGNISDKDISRDHLDTLEDYF